MTKTRFALAVLAVPLAVLAAGCGGSSSSGGSTGSTDVKGNVSITGVWTGDEQKSFQAVLDAFMEKYPKWRVKNNSSAENPPAVFSTAFQAAIPPDLAAVSQPGLMKDFQKKGALKP